MFAGDQAGILVGMGALEAGGGGVVFRFSSGFWDGVGWEPLSLDVSGLFFTERQCPYL